MPLPMACQDTFSNGEWDALGYKECGKGVSYLPAWNSSASLLSLGSQGGQEVWGERWTDMKPLLTQTEHPGPTVKLYVSTSLQLLRVGSSLCVAAPWPGHCRLQVLCSCNSCFWLACRTWAGKPVWVALWAHLEVLVNAQLTLLSKKNVEVWIRLQACQCWGVSGCATTISCLKAGRKLWKSLSALILQGVSSPPCLKQGWQHGRWKGQMEHSGTELKRGGRDQGVYSGWWESTYNHFSLYIWESWQHEVFLLLGLSPFT